MTRSETHEALLSVTQERLRQESLRSAGRFSQTCADPAMPEGMKLSVLVEEVGEVARVLCEKGGVNDKRNKDLREELVQVAAVAVAWVEAIDKECNL